MKLTTRDKYDCRRQISSSRGNYNGMAMISLFLVVVFLVIQIGVEPTVLVIVGVPVPIDVTIRYFVPDLSFVSKMI
jgi:hypothetical protein